MTNQVMPQSRSEPALEHPGNSRNATVDTTQGDEGASMVFFKSRFILMRTLGFG